MDTTTVGKWPALVMVALLAAPPSARSISFEERFAWRGNHAATIGNRLRSTVWWNEDAWDARGNTQRIDGSDGAYSIDVQPASADFSDGRPADRYVLGGDGSDGMGVMMLPAEGSIGARLRNPMLISAGTPGVVEFRTTQFNTSGHWWEVAISPTVGTLVGLEQTSIPHSPGYVTPMDSLNILARNTIDDGPCYWIPTYGEPVWFFNMHMERTVGGVVTGAQGPGLRTAQEDGDVLDPWRIEYYPDRVEVYGDMNRDGLLELLQTFNIVVPWAEVYVHLLAVSYGGGTRHPQGNLANDPGGCVTYPKDRNFSWKDVRVSPVKYARTASFPKNAGTSAVPRDTGWVKQDGRDMLRFGTAADGTAYANAGSYERNSTAAFTGGLQPGTFHPAWMGVASNDRTLSFDLSSSEAAGVGRAKLVYDVRGRGPATLEVNGTPVGSLPVKDRSPADMQDNALFWQRSIDFDPALLHLGTNTITVRCPPATAPADNRNATDFERLHVELSYGASGGPSGPPPAAPRGIRFR